MAFSISVIFISSDTCLDRKKKKSFERLSLLLFKKSTIMFNKSDFTALRHIGRVTAWKKFK